MLRGIKGTYLYICDEALRQYIAQYVPWADQAAATVKDEETPLEPYINSVPLYDLKAAAGGFSELQQVWEDTDWVRVPIHIPITKNHFACQVVGQSMNKVIPNGSICLFRKDNGGSIIKPLSDDLAYEPIVLEGDELVELKVVGLFEGVLQE